MHSNANHLLFGIRARARPLGNDIFFGLIVGGESERDTREGGALAERLVSVVRASSFPRQARLRRRGMAWKTTSVGEGDRGRSGGEGFVAQK